MLLVAMTEDAAAVGGEEEPVMKPRQRKAAVQTERERKTYSSSSGSSIDCRVDGQRICLSPIPFSSSSDDARNKLA